MCGVGVALQQSSLDKLSVILVSSIINRYVWRVSRVDRWRTALWPFVRGDTHFFSYNSQVRGCRSYTRNTEHGTNVSHCYTTLHDKSETRICIHFV